MAVKEASKIVVVTNPASRAQDVPSEQSAAMPYDELLPYLWLAMAGSF